MSGTQQDGSSLPGSGPLHPHLLRGGNGAQLKHIKKLVRQRHGSHTSRGDEVIFTEPHKGIHGDAHDVCWWWISFFRQFCHLFCLLCETCETVIVFFMQQAGPFKSTPFRLFLDSFAQGQLVSAYFLISFMFVVTKKGVRWDYLCYHHLADVLSVSILKTNCQSFVGSCVLSTVFSSRTVYTERAELHNQGAVWCRRHKNVSWKHCEILWYGKQIREPAHGVDHGARDHAGEYFCNN